MLTRVTEVYLFALLGSGQAGKIVKQSALVCCLYWV